MIQSEQLIHSFYTAFLARDYTTMQNCYTNDATFSDPVFQNLNAAEVKGMWEMFCKRSNDMHLTYSIRFADENHVEAIWIPDYTFSATGRHVTNHIKSRFTIKDNKIIRHHDHFSFYKWSSQALGIPGILFGWTPLIKNKIRKSANINLQKFMATNELAN